MQEEERLTFPFLFWIQKVKIYNKKINPQSISHEHLIF